MGKAYFGFSLVELVLVLLLLSIISAVAAPRFFNSTPFLNNSVRTNFQSTLTYAHNRATTSQCTLEFRITNTGWSVLQDDDCQSTGSSGASCSAPLNFITPVNAPGESTQLTGTLTSNSLQRLFFTPTGRLYRSTTAGDCTNLPANPVPSGTLIVGLTPATTLRLDGVTGYVAIQ